MIQEEKDFWSDQTASLQWMQEHDINGWPCGYGVYVIFDENGVELDGTNVIIN